MFKKKYFKIILITLFLFGFCLAVKAAGGGIDLQVPIPGQPEAGNDLASYISGWYTFGMGAISVVAVVMIMWSGFQWMTALGNAAAIGQAKQRISNAIVGLILAFCSYGLLYLINPALVELKMPRIPSITKEAIREYDMLQLIGTDCVKSADCQGTVEKPNYDLMCFLGCPDGTKPMSEKNRQCLPIKDYKKWCFPGSTCSNYKKLCWIKSADDKGDCCDYRLVCNTYYRACREYGEKGDKCKRDIECKSGDCSGILLGVLGKKCQ